MNWFFIVQYHSGGQLKLIMDIETGLVHKFNTRKDAKRYAIKNCLGIFKIYEFDYE
jgi:hypothetical protein